MRSLSKILKASTVKIDSDNKVSIKVESIPQISQPVEEEKPEEEDIDIEEAKPNPEDIIEEARKEAGEIIKNAVKEAQEEVRQIKNSANEEIKEAEEAAKARGYEEGYNKGLQESEEIKNRAREAYDNTLLELEEMKVSLEPEMLELIIEILNKLIKGANNFNPQLIMCLIRQGLSDVAAGEILIHVSPSDYDAVQENKNEIFSMINAGSRVEIIKDLSLNLSDCIIETSLGNIECSLDAQFNALKQNLYYILENRE